jgi:hypothetical protein
MRNVTDTSCRKNQNTHFVFSKFFSEYRAVYEAMWVDPESLQMTIWRMRISRWIPKATRILILCNTYCVHITVVTRTRRIVTLYVHYLSRHRYLYCLPQPPLFANVSKCLFTRDL